MGARKPWRKKKGGQREKANQIYAKPQRGGRTHLVDEGFDNLWVAVACHGETVVVGLKGRTRSEVLRRPRGRRSGRTVWASAPKQPGEKRAA